MKNKIIASLLIGFTILILVVGLLLVITTSTKIEVSAMQICIKQLEIQQLQLAEDAVVHIEAELAEQNTDVVTALHDMKEEYIAMLKVVSCRLMYNNIQDTILNIQNMIHDFESHMSQSDYRGQSTSGVDVAALRTAVIAIVAGFQTSGMRLAAELLQHNLNNTIRYSHFTPVHGHRLANSNQLRRIAQHDERVVGYDIFPNPGAPIPIFNLIINDYDKDAFYAVAGFNFMKEYYDATRVRMHIKDLYIWNQYGYTGLVQSFNEIAFQAQEAGVLTPFFTTVPNLIMQGRVPFKYTLGNGEAIITGAPSYVTDLVIPPYIRDFRYFYRGGVRYQYVQQPLPVRIGANAFSNNRNVTSIRLLNRFENDLFGRPYQPTRYYLGNVTEIGNNAFANATRLNKFLNLSTVPQQINSTTFAGVSRQNLRVYVPGGKLQSYIGAGWSGFNMREVIPWQQPTWNSLSNEHGTLRGDSIAVGQPWHAFDGNPNTRVERGSQSNNFRYAHVNLQLNENIFVQRVEVVVRARQSGSDLITAQGAWFDVRLNNGSYDMVRVSRENIRRTRGQNFAHQEANNINVRLRLRGARLYLYEIRIIALQPIPEGHEVWNQPNWISRDTTSCGLRHGTISERRTTQWGIGGALSAPFREDVNRYNYAVMPTYLYLNLNYNINVHAIYISARMVRNGAGNVTGAISARAGNHQAPRSILPYGGSAQLYRFEFHGLGTNTIRIDYIPLSFSRVIVNEIRIVATVSGNVWIQPRWTSSTNDHGSVMGIQDSGVQNTVRAFDGNPQTFDRFHRPPGTGLTGHNTYLHLNKTIRVYRIEILFDLHQYTGRDFRSTLGVCGGTMSYSPRVLTRLGTFQTETFEFPQGAIVNSLRIRRGLRYGSFYLRDIRIFAVVDPNGPQVWEQPEWINRTTTSCGGNHGTVTYNPHSVNRPPSHAYRAFNRDNTAARVPVASWLNLNLDYNVRVYGIQVLVRCVANAPNLPSTGAVQVMAGGQASARTPITASGGKTWVNFTISAQETNTIRVYAGVYHATMYVYEVRILATR